MNQIATLNNRVGYLVSALATPNTWSPPNYSPTMNPAPAFDISGSSYLGFLGSAYSSDENLMLSNLGACLAATSSNVSTVCAPITTLYGTGSQAIIGSAYAWYTNGGDLTGSKQTPNNIAAQNTIALQYASTVYVSTPKGSTSFPLDVMWVDGLPSFPTSWQGLPAGIEAPSGSALVAFADEPYYWPGGGDSSATFTSPYVFIMPTSTTSMSAPASNYNQYGFNFAEYDYPSTLGWQWGSGSVATTYYPQECNSYSPAYPTFTNPCGITTSYGNSVQAAFGQISDFFGD